MDCTNRFKMLEWVNHSDKIQLHKQHKYFLEKVVSHYQAKFDSIMQI